MRAYIDDLIPDILEGRIQPGRVFDRTVALEGVPDGYRAMNECEAIKVMVRPRSWCWASFSTIQTIAIFAQRLGLGQFSKLWDERAMTTRTASCSCGQLRVTCEGEPVRISICHCLECQKRTGGVFGAQARFPRADVTIEGRSTQWRRTGDSGGTATFEFCPACGSTVCWTADGLPQFVTVAVGAFADPNFPPPRVSVYEERRHPWALTAPDLPLEHQV